MNDASRGRVAWLLHRASANESERDHWYALAALHMVKDFQERKAG